MGLNRKLVNKLKRRNRFMQRNNGFLRQDKINKNDEILQGNPNAFGLMRKVERRLDRNFGIESAPAPAKLLLEKMILVNDIDRFDFDPGAGTDYGLRLRVDVEVAGASEATDIEVTADDGAFEEFTFDFPSTALATQADYAYFTAPSGATYAAWLDIDAAGTEPTGALYVGADNQIMVSIATLGTAIDTAAAFVTALGAVTDLTITDNLDGSVSLVSGKLGNLPDASVHNAADSGAGSITKNIDVQGSSSSLQGIYLEINSHTKRFWVWINVNGEGIAPTLTEAVSLIEVALSGGESSTNVAVAMASAIDALSAFAASSALAIVSVSNSATGTAIDATDINTGFAITVNTQGIDEVNRKSFSALGVRPGDVIQMLEGTLKGKEYTVVSVINNNTLRLEDDSAEASPETDKHVKVRLSSIKKSYV